MSLVCSNVTKSYDSNHVLSGVNLQAGKGSIFSLVGPSGSGKTTLLNILASYDTPTSGTVEFNGINLLGCSSTCIANYRFRVGFIHQEPQLVGDMSSIENVLLPFVPRVSAESIASLKSSAIELAQSLGLGHVLNRRAALLSTGEKKRLDLIRALLRDPWILLADEPTANLDEKSASIIVSLLEETSRRKQIPIIFSVHRDSKLMAISKTRINMEDPVRAS